MNWYKFMAYFAIWAGALANIYAAFSYYTGHVYGGEVAANFVYSFLPSLKTIDMIYATCALVASVIAFITGVSLLKFKSNAPSLLTLTYVAVIIAPIIYIASFYIAFPELNNLNNYTNSISSLVVSIIVSIVMMFVNRVYFNKRRHLFVN